MTREERKFDYKSEERLYRAKIWLQLYKVGNAIAHGPNEA